MLKKILFFLLTIFIAGSTAFSQPVIGPLMGHDILGKMSPGMETGSDYIYTIYIFSEDTHEFCLPSEVVATQIDTIIDLKTSVPDSVTITTIDSCFSITANETNVYHSDTLKLEVIDTSGRPSIVTLIINSSGAQGLPFIEDFSDDRKYPAREKWQDRDVFINRTLSIRPPSIGVATFDGVDHNGAPYRVNDGIGDYLTSTFIDVSGSEDPHLHFWIQPRGYGFEGFPMEADSFRVEFKTKEGNWEIVAAYPGINDDPLPEFEAYKIPISTKYQSEKFQFRFSNRTDRPGVLSMWHLDYVFVTPEPLDLNNIQDIAFSDPPPFILKPYSSMPYAHFKGNEDKYLFDSIEIGVQNNYNSTRPNDGGGIELVEQITGTELISFETLLDLPPIVDVNQRNLEPGFHFFTNAIKTYDEMLSAAGTINQDPNDFLKFQLKNYFSSDDDRAELRMNNLDLESITLMEDYFAYDDGTPEGGIYISAGSDLPYLVQEFEFEVEDTLQGIQLHFPHVFPKGDRQRFRLVFWSGELEGDPDYRYAYDGPIYVDKYYQDSSYSFTTLTLKNEDDQDTSYVIPKGKLYVGWQQISSSTELGLYVGFDRNHDNSDKIWYNSASTWRNLAEEVPEINGSIMIRPIVGNAVIYSTKTEEVADIKTNIYPNPAENLLNIQVNEELSILNEWTLEIYSMNGSLVRSFPYQNTINLSSLHQGYYILRILDANNRQRKAIKFLKK